MTDREIQNVRHVCYLCPTCDLIAIDSPSIAWNELESCYVHTCGCRIAIVKRVPNDSVHIKVFNQADMLWKIPEKLPLFPSTIPDPAAWTHCDASDGSGERIKYFCYHCLDFSDYLGMSGWDDHSGTYDHDCGFRVNMALPAPNREFMKVFHQADGSVEVRGQWPAAVRCTNRSRPTQPRESVQEESQSLRNTDSSSRHQTWDSSSFFLSEKPYAAVLADDYRTIRCSNCFEPASAQCESECSVVYCDDKCARSDQNLHEFECQALRKDPTILMAVNLRIIGRVARRLQMDQGEVALADGLPDFVHSRSFHELAQHYDEMKASRVWSTVLDRVEQTFLAFFADTPLAQVPTSQIGYIFAVLWTNAFYITVPTSVASSATIPTAEIGLGLYLNTTRFDHSCTPDLLYRFRGPDMHMHLNAFGPRSASEVRQLAASSEETYDRIRTTYEIPVKYANGCLVTSSKQTIEWSQEILFFACDCPRCGDATRIESEEHSSVHECTECGMSLVWSGGKAELKRQCECRGDIEGLDGMTTEEVQKDLHQLEEQWIQLQSTDSNDLDRVETLCTSVLPLAQQYWSTRCNLRLGQIYDRLYHIELSRLLTAVDLPIDESHSTRTIELGERMMRIYLQCVGHYWDMRLVTPCLQLAALHKRFGEGKKEVIRWLKEAERILAENGDAENVERVRAMDDQ